jgi:sugar phosphate permease
MISQAPAFTEGDGRSKLRWSVAFLVGAAIAISYLDRQTLPWAINAIQQDIPFSNQMKAGLDSAFLVTYGLMYIGGGLLLDWLGTRRGFLCIMIFWSLACASHGFAMGVVMLAGSRLLLGMGEGGGFPAATRAVAEWFPVNDRATAMGIINAGTAVGGVIAPLGIFFDRRAGAVMDGLVVAKLSRTGPGRQKLRSNYRIRNGGFTRQPASASRNLGNRRGKIFERWGVVFLPLLAAKIFI